MSHTVVLEEFLRSGLSTALIIEDDVDWDIRLKTIQIPSAAATHQFLLGRSSESIWASTHQWDLMYLGHCGDYFTTLDDMQVGTGILHPADLDDIPHVLYRDATLPDPTDLHPFTASFLNAFNVPPNTRLLHQARWPLCSFGYAITRSTAHRLLYELAIPHERPGKWTKAYDIALLEACRDNHLRCFTISPELLHHMEGTSLINGDVADRTERAPADRVGLRQVLYRNETSNIGCGFWSGDFDWHGDLNHLLYLREEVGRKGRCLKPGRREDGSYLPQLPGSGGREQQARVQEPGHRQHITPARVHRKPY
ncbi:hypothetical protein KVT40_007225 [Elsinoe batatas]|uniref:Glycosyltransferase family 25 protein n=1 Tax=Elsinoe batatas TaxID=2601811 RepID=A0A8K0KWY7_9PEZI|nr:hypothetical protein KVT40_007225 [Elsinoe batatas]